MTGNSRVLAWTFAQRELKTRFKDTALGWIWSLVIPLSSLAVYSIVFGVIFKADAPRFGSHREAIYPVWLFCGLVAFGFFSAGVLRGIDAVIGASGLMRKIELRPYIPLVGAIIAGGFQTVVEIALVLAVLAMLGNVSFVWLLLPLWAVLFFVFTAGVAMMCAVASAHLRDVAQITAILMQFAFFATPVIYPVDQIPPDVMGGALRNVIEVSPIAHFVEMFRDVTYSLDKGSLGGWLYLAVSAGVAIALAAAVNARYGRDLAEKL